MKWLLCSIVKIQWCHQAESFSWFAINFEFCEENQFPCNRLLMSIIYSIFFFLLLKLVSSYWKVKTGHFSLYNVLFIFYSCCLFFLYIYVCVCLFITFFFWFHLMNFIDWRGLALLLWLAHWNFTCRMSVD